MEDLEVAQAAVLVREQAVDHLGATGRAGAVGEAAQQPALLVGVEQLLERAAGDLLDACSRARARSTGSGRGPCCSASSTVIRSLEFCTSVANRASLARRWTSAESSALLSASAT